MVSENLQVGTSYTQVDPVNELSHELDRVGISKKTAL